MLVGVLLLLVALLAVFIGTKDSEATVLYYDADFEPIEQEGNKVENPSEDFVQDGLGGEQSVIAPEPPKPKPAPKPEPPKPKPDSKLERKVTPPSGAEELRKAAAENDPNAAAQALFDSLKGGKW